MRAVFQVAGALFRLLGIIAVLLVGIVAGVLVALQFDWAREGLKDTILANLNAGIQGRVEIDRLGGTLPFSVELEGVRIYDPDGAEVLAVKRLETGIRVFGLLDRQIDVARVAIVEPSVSLFDGNGGIGLARAFAPRTPSPSTPDTPSEPGTPWVIKVRSIALDSARIESLVPGQNVDLYNLDLSVAITIDGDGVHWRDLRLLSFVSTSGAFDWVNDGGGLSVLTDGTLGANTIAIDKFELQLGPQGVSLSGLVDLTGENGGALTVNALRVDGAGWDFLPAELRGELNGQGDVSLTRDAVSLALGLESHVGNVELQAGADLNIAGIMSRGEAPSLGLWSVHLGASHLRPAKFLPDIPVEGSDVGLNIDFDGRDFPTSPSHQLEGTIDIVGLTVAGQAGRALTTVRYLPATSEDEAGWGVQVELGKLDLQPWLGYVGMPLLEGVVDGARVRGLVTLRDTPTGLVPTLAFTGGVRLEANGLIPSGDVDAPVSVKQVRSHFQLQWDGVGLPEAAVFVSGEELKGFGVEADLVRARIFGATPTDNGVDFRGSVEASRLSLPGLSIAKVEMPIEGRVVSRSDGGVEVAWARIEPDVEGFALGDSTRWRRLRGLLRLEEEDPGHHLHGRLSVLGLAAGPAEVEETELVVDLSVPRVDGPELLGPGRALGTVGLVVTRVVVGPGTKDALRVATAESDWTVVWPRGLLDVLDVDGRVTLTGFEGAGATVASGELTLDGRVAPQRPELTDLISNAHLVATLEDIAFTNIPLLARRPVKSAAIVARTTDDGSVPLELDVTLDERYRFKTLADLRLPTRRTPVSGAVEALELTDTEHDRAIIRLDGAILSPEGIISVSGLNLLGPTEAAGRATVGGYLDTRGEEIDANIDLTGLDIEAFLKMGDEILRRPIISGARLGGRVDADIDVYGALKAPTLSLSFKLADGTLNDGTGVTADLKLDAVPTGVKANLVATWREGGGSLDVTADLPGAWALDPIGIVWDDTRRIIVDAKVSEPDLHATQKALATLVGVSLPYKLAGALEADLHIGGRPGAATSDFHLKTTNLVVGDFDDADIQIALGTNSPDTNLDLMVVRRSGALLARVRTSVPFTLMRAVMHADPMGYAEGRMFAEPMSAKIDIPFTRLGQTPLVAALPVEMKDVGVGVDLAFEGTLSQPDLRGSIDVSGLEMLPEESVTRVQLVTVLDTLQASATTTGRDGTLWVDADLSLPGLSRIAQHPDRAVDVLSDPAFSANVFTADLATFDFWRILPDVGDPASQFMPDGSLMVTVNARGGAEGPTANAVARLRTHAPSSGRDSDLDPRTRAGFRNIANDIVITARMSPKETSARILMLQEPSVASEAGEAPAEAAARPDGDVAPVAPGAPTAELAARGAEHLGAELSLELGTAMLLAGEPLDIARLKLVGHIDAVNFRLAGLAATMRSVLGSTAGALFGRIDVVGTIEKPKFSGRLVLKFDDLAIAPIGLRREDVELKLAFDDNNRVTLTGLAFEEPADEGDKPATMALDFAATIAALDAEKIAIEGGASWWRFPVVSRKDASVRMTGDIAIAGTVAKPRIKGEIAVDKATLTPSLASRSVRVIGLPAGVTLVRGEPEPPATKPEPKVFRTGADIDIAVRVPVGSTHLEPALFLAVGEVRAVLEPNTGDQPLYIRTTQGRLGIFGTVYVPKENVEVYGKKFVMDEDSRIIFTGDMDTDPQLRITARYNIAHIDLSPIGLQSARDSNVGIKVNGNAVDPGITFVSDPRMDEGNMLSIIALGTPSGGGDAIASQARGQLLSAFLSMATLELGRGLTETLPIEVLKLDSLTGDNDLRLTVGKRITDDLYIYYRSEWGGTRRTNTVWAEYRLGRILYVSAEYGDNANPERPAETSVRASVRITP